MKSIIALLLCLAVAIAEVPSSIKEYRTKDIQDTQYAPGKEFKYYYDSQILSGIPQASNRRSGQRIQAEVTVQVPQRNEFVIQLKHIKFGSLNQRVPDEDRVILPVDAFESLHLKHEQKSKLEEPIKAVLRDGMITELKYDSSEPAWAINIKRSVLNMLSTNLKAKNEVVPPKFCNGNRCGAHPARSPSGERQFFTAYEETIEGSCEVTYTIVRNPAMNGRSEHVLNVTKAVDLSKCRSVTPGKPNERPEVRYLWHLSDSCPTAAPRSQFLNASTIMRLDVSGTRDSNLIERVEAVSEYVVPDLSPEGNVITTKVNSSLILIESSPIGSPLNAPSSSSEKHGKSLIYSLSWDSLREDFYRQGSAESSEESPFAPNPKKVEIVKKLLKKLAEELAPSKADKALDIHAPTTFLQIVRTLRMMNSEELNKLHREAFSSSLSGLEAEESQAIKDIIHSAMAAAGTQPAVEKIAEKIKNGELSQFQAAVAVRQLMNARVVSKKMIDDVKSMVSSVSANEKPALKQASMLALGAMARTFCVNRNDKFASAQHTAARQQPEECTEATRRELVNYFVEYLKSTQNWNQQVLAIKSLANAALPESIPELSKIIKSSQHKEIVRVQAAIALRPLRSIVAEQVVALTMPIFMDTSIPVPVRIASAYIAITSNPKPAVLKSMVQQLNRDESQQVKSFLFTYLSNLANNTFASSPCNERLASEAKIALQYAKEEAKISAGSFLSQTALHSQARKYGLDFELASTMSNSSYLPQVLGASINGDFLGFFNRDLLSLTISTENIDQAVRQLVNYVSSSETENRASRYRRSAPSVSELRQKLSEMTRNFEAASPEASKLLAQARVLGQEVGFMPLDKSILEYIQETFSVAQLEAAAQPLNLNLASVVSEKLYKIPTTMGLPLTISRQSPMIAQMKGSIGKRSDSNYLIRDVDMLSSVAGKTELTVEIWSPLSQTGLKVREEARVQIPLRGSIKKPASTDSQPRYEIELKTPTSEGREMITLKTTPFSFTQQWSSDASEYPQPKLQIIAPVQQSRVSKMEKRIDIMGVRAELRSSLSSLNFERPSSSPLSPLSGPNAIHLTLMKSPESPAEKITLRGYLSRPKLVQQPLESDVHSINTQEEGSSEESSEESEAFSSPQHYESKILLSAQSHPSGLFRAVNIVRKTSPDSRLQKTEAKVFKTESQGAPEFCAETQLLFPDYPQKTADLSRKVNARHVFAWGPNCKVDQANHKVEILEQGERTKAKREMEEKSIRDYHYCKDGRRSPIECYQFIEKASELNKYTFMINYPGMPIWAKNYTQKVFSQFLGAHRYQADIDRYSQSAANQIKAVIRMDPFNPRQENITIQEPGSKVVLKDVYVTPAKDHMAFNMVSRQVAPLTVSPVSSVATCMVSDRQIMSFDQAGFQAPVTDCWSVIAKDCSPETRFAVLLKRMSMGSPAKKIRVLTKSELIEISKDGEDFVMRVNGAEKTIPDSKTAEAGQQAYARQVGQSVVRIVVPEESITIYFDGESAAVRVPPTYFNKQCGLCGHYNRDASDIFRGTERERHSSVLEFFKQYQIQEGSCQQTPSESHKYRKEAASDESTSGERQPSYRRPQEVSPVDRNRIANEGGQICVSKRAVKTCPQGYYAKETVSREVEFGCIEDHYDGLEVEAMAQDSAIAELPEFSEEFSRSVRIATKCRRY